VARTRDLGDGFTVHRALPAGQRQMVGPFIFLDQMGPQTLAAGQGLDVRPHPHIGLATVTYLFEGAILHRDSLGNVQRIEPGAVNWMTAGRGIVHSERSPAEARVAPQTVSGVQIWVAVPKADEESAPSFEHLPKAALPTVDDAGLQARVLAGSLFGQRSPAPIRSELFLAEVQLQNGASVQLKAEHPERAAYVAQGELEVGNVALKPGDLPVFRRDGDVILRAKAPSRVLLFGGEPLEGPRHIVWNFVSSSADRIAQAKEDWQNQRFPEIPGETERIPLPEGLPSPVDRERP
jgi:redox-sensitive bicupin YhaK (pirin superfamily)